MGQNTRKQKKTNGEPGVNWCSLSIPCIRMAVQMDTSVSRLSLFSAQTQWYQVSLSEMSHLYHCYLKQIAAAPVSANWCFSALYRLCVSLPCYLTVKAKGWAI
jgi:hypothetical protein